MSWSGGGWGTWHTSSAIDAPCPQGCGRHSVADAVDLNEAERVRRQEGLRIAHERWLHDGNVPDSVLHRSDELGERVHLREGDGTDGRTVRTGTAVGRGSDPATIEPKGYL